MPRLEGSLQLFNVGQKPGSAEMCMPNLDKVNENEGFAAENYFSKHGLYDQLTLNDYLPGDGIPPHVDTHSPFCEVFASLSLGSGTTMQFKRATPDENLK